MSAAKFLRSLLLLTFGVLLASVLLVTWPTPAHSNEKARIANNSRRAANLMSFRMNYYTDRNEGRLPESDKWTEELSYQNDKEGWNTSIIPELSADGEQYYFSLFEQLSGVDVSTVLNPEDVPVFFETDGGAPHFTCGLEDIARPHNGGVYVVFLDGHVDLMPETWDLKTVKIELNPNPSNTVED